MEAEDKLAILGTGCVMAGYSLGQIGNIQSQILFSALGIIALVASSQAILSKRMFKELLRRLK